MLVRKALRVLLITGIAHHEGYKDIVYITGIAGHKDYEGIIDHEGRKGISGTGTKLLESVIVSSGSWYDNRQRYWRFPGVVLC